MKSVRRRSSTALDDLSPILEVEALTLRRGSTTILEGVSWRVARAEHWAIVGANGCGKTTLLRALTGYLSATSGKIALLGKRYGETDWRELRVHIGLVTSALQPSIPPAEIALETVISGKYAQLDLWMEITRADRAAALQLLREVRLDYLAERPWLYLSQGERQRVLIARALMAQPRLLILDEPCAGLDPVARETFLQFVQHLAARKESPSLVLVTHHVEEILPVFSHALLLRGGRVVAAGLRQSTLTSRLLSTAFGHPVRLSRRKGRLHLSVAAPRRSEKA